MSHSPGAKRYCPSRAATPGIAWRSLFTALALAAALGGGPARAAADHAHRHDMPMSDEAMKAEAEAYWATHAPVGAAPATSPEETHVVTATFTVGNFLFDNGGAAQVDTAKILVGESVQWNWIAGFHTVTNGTDSFDPGAGTLFNQPSDSSHPTFVFQFNSTGTFPFFCAFHEFQNMRGVVVVSTPTGVGPAAAPALGFTRDPAPNPTRTGMSFQYALGTAGRVRAEVFDAGGRRVVLLVDRDMPAGAHTATWDGRTGAGPADTGVYYVRLRLPGYDQSRSVVIRR